MKGNLNKARGGERALQGGEIGWANVLRGVCARVNIPDKLDSRICIEELGEMSQPQGYGRRDVSGGGAEIEDFKPKTAQSFLTTTTAQQ